MGATITSSLGGTITPADDPLLSQSTETRHVVHLIADARYPQISFIPSTARRGEIFLFFRDDEEALMEAIELFVDGTTFQLAYPERPSWECAFVVTGEIAPELDDESRNHWTLRVPYQEIAPEDY